MKQNCAWIVLCIAVLQIRADLSFSHMRVQSQLHITGSSSSGLFPSNVTLQVSSGSISPPQTLLNRNVTYKLYRRQSTNALCDVRSDDLNNTFISISVDHVSRHADGFQLEYFVFHASVLLQKNLSTAFHYQHKERLFMAELKISGHSENVQFKEMHSIDGPNEPCEEAKNDIELLKLVFIGPNLSSPCIDKINQMMRQLIPTIQIEKQIMSFVQMTAVVIPRQSNNGSNLTEVSFQFQGSSLCHESVLQKINEQNLTKVIDDFGQNLYLGQLDDGEFTFKKINDEDDIESTLPTSRWMYLYIVGGIVGAIAVFFFIIYGLNSALKQKQNDGEAYVDAIVNHERGRGNKVNVITDSQKINAVIVTSRMSDSVRYSQCSFSNTSSTS